MSSSHLIHRTYYYGKAMFRCNACEKEATEHRERACDLIVKTDTHWWGEIPMRWFEKTGAKDVPYKEGTPLGPDTPVIPSLPTLHADAVQDENIVGGNDRVDPHIIVAAHTEMNAYARSPYGTLIQQNTTTTLPASASIRIERADLEVLDRIDIPNVLVWLTNDLTSDEAKMLVRSAISAFNLDQERYDRGIELKSHSHHYEYTTERLECMRAEATARATSLANISKAGEQQSGAILTSIQYGKERG